MSDTSPQPIDFSGKTAIHYDECLGPLYFEPYGLEISNHIDPSRVSLALEIAAGTGRITHHLRDRVPPSGKLVASDISEDMLTIAKNKLKDADIDWQIIDAQQLPFKDNSIDLIVCCFGYMFVPDKPKAFAEAHRVLKPGGMLLFTTWDKLENNAISYAYRSAAKKYLPDALAEYYNTALSMSDETAIHSFVQNAGFSKITIERVKQLSVTATAKDAINIVSRGGPIYEEIISRNPSWIDEIRITAEKELSEKYGTAPMKAPMSAIFCRAWK